MRIDHDLGTGEEIVEQLSTRMKQTIIKAVQDINRPDLFREPLIGFSSANDPSYQELKTIIGPWHRLPGELLDEAVSVISYFVPFTRAVVMGPTSTVDASYVWGEAYQEINRQFPVIDQLVSELLHDYGFQTQTVPPSHTYDPVDLQCYWSHRSTAVIAGLGRIGANRMVITDKGSGGRFCSIITTAHLEPNQTVAKERCLWHINRSCQKCFDICPVNALGPDVMDKFACQDLLNKYEADLIRTTALESADACGKCISVCPVAYIE